MNSQFERRNCHTGVTVHSVQIDFVRVGNHGDSSRATRKATIESVMGALIGKAE
jgi:hypothetical protein